MAKVSLSQIKKLRDETNVGIVEVKKALDEANGDNDKAMEILRKKGAKAAAAKSGNKTENGLIKVAVDGDLAVIVEVNSETDTLTTDDHFTSLVDLIAKTILKNKPANVDDALKLSTDKGTLKDAITHVTQITHENINIARFHLIQKSANEHFGGYVHNGGQIGSLVLLKGADDTVAENIAMHVTAMAPEYLEPSDISQDRIDKETTALKQEVANSKKPEKIIKMIIKGRLNKKLSQICLTKQQFVMNSDMTVAKYVASKKGAIKSFDRYAVGEK